MVPQSEYSQTADRRSGLHFAPLKIQSYWTKGHQIFKPCSQIIADESFEIKIVGLKCQSDE